MNSKLMQVEIAASLVNNIIATSPWRGNSIVVDAGDGKGYLSSRLALEYGHTVLGIDSNIINTANAMERSRKLKVCCMVFLELKNEVFYLNLLLLIAESLERLKRKIRFGIQRLNSCSST